MLDHGKDKLDDEKCNTWMVDPMEYNGSNEEYKNAHVSVLKSLLATPTVENDVWKHASNFVKYL